MRKYLKIALPLPLNQLFTYSIDTEQRENLIGCRAIVPFGNKLLTGFIIEINNTSDFERIKSISELIDEKPIFNENLLKLAKWIAEYYMASLGETLKAMLPAGMTIDTSNRIKWIRIPTDVEFEHLKKKAPVKAAILKNIAKHNGFVSIKTIEKECRSSISKSQIDWLVNNRYVEYSEHLTDLAKSKSFKAAFINQHLFSNEKLLIEVINTIESKSKKAAKVISYIYELQAQNKIPYLKDLSEIFNYTYASINNLAKKGILEIKECEKEFHYQKEIKLSNRDESILKLTEEQKFASEKIIESVNKNEFKPFLLHGVTGSGKTLVYIKVIKQVIENNQNAIFMLPEISLTPQLIDRLRNSFGNQIAILHSHLSKNDRYESWKMIYENRAKVVIGARSALFAPFDNLGVIIVDEEHESSFKQDSPNPKYHGRDSAVIRAMIENCPVILGSATPSIESMFNARSGKYQLLEINNRADGAFIPEIHAIDMLNAGKQGMLYGSFSKDLLEDIEITKKKKEGIILLQNRRGFANLMHCNSCGNIPKCQNCDVSMTYHKIDNSLRCHYCGFTYKKSTCENCSSSDLSLIGTGTQRIEDELVQYFANKNLRLNIERFDLDTTSRKGAHRSILQRFANNETDLLIGTQMVAKGIDFEHVTLVGVLNADLQLNMPDFRANERTFQLITQVAGRAGRSSSKKGKVLIQTSNPEYPILKFIISNNYNVFFEHELALRKESFYPPYSRFCKIEFNDVDIAKLKLASNTFYELIPNHSAYLVYEPVEPLINKIKNNFRYFVIIKSNKKADPSGNILRQALKSTIEKFTKINKNTKLKYSIDIDAVSTL